MMHYNIPKYSNWIIKSVITLQIIAMNSTKINMVHSMLIIFNSSYTDSESSYIDCSSSGVLKDLNTSMVQIFPY